MEAKTQPLNSPETNGYKDRKPRRKHKRSKRRGSQTKALTTLEQTQNQPRKEMIFVPPEILREIFLIHLKQRPTRYCSFVPVPPSVVSIVCRYWRAVAISMPEMWHTFSFSFYGSEGAKRRQYIENRINICLERSKSYPLDITFYCDLGQYDNDEMHQAAERIIKALLSQQHRWRKVNFSWKDVYLSEGLRSINVTYMPMLTKLKLQFKFESNDWKPVYGNIDIRHSPRLKDMVVSGIFSIKTDEGHLNTKQKALLKNARKNWAKKKVTTLTWDDGQNGKKRHRKQEHFSYPHLRPLDLEDLWWWSQY